jgi:hypothetical protein
LGGVEEIPQKSNRAQYVGSRQELAAGVALESTRLIIGTQYIRMNNIF